MDTSRSGLAWKSRGNGLDICRAYGMGRRKDPLSRDLNFPTVAEEEERALAFCGATGEREVET